MNVETASRNRASVIEIGETPFFHANMYLHLHKVQQVITTITIMIITYLTFGLYVLCKKVQDENSVSRQNRAALLPKRSKSELLSLLGDTADTMYPIYMTGKR